MHRDSLISNTNVECQGLTSAAAVSPWNCVLWFAIDMTSNALMMSSGRRCCRPWHPAPFSGPIVRRDTGLGLRAPEPGISSGCGSSETVHWRSESPFSRVCSFMNILVASSCFCLVDSSKELSGKINPLNTRESTI